MFAELFGGKTRFRALSCLFENSDRSFGIRELAEEADLDPGNLARLIKRWEKAGLVVAVNDRGVRYQASADPALKPLENLFRQSNEFISALKALLEPIREVESALIYGSYAGATATVGSDVDVLVIGDLSELKLNAKLKPLARQYGRPINASVIDAQAFRAQLEKGDPVATSICTQSRILLKGECPCR